MAQKIKQTVVIQSGRTIIEVGSLIFTEGDEDTPRRLSAAKQIVRNALIAASYMFPAQSRGQTTVRTITTGVA